MDNDNQTIKVRFAPSPTGFLHVGNVRTALANFLFARQQGGIFMLRIDDTDLERSRHEYETAIEQDLAWLGIEWQVKEKQSARLAKYEAAKQKLLASGRIYACYETAEELDIRRKMLVSRGKPPIYERTSLNLSAAQLKQYEAEGRRPHYRFLLEDKDIVWTDLIRGETKFSGSFASDPVVFREDGMPLFTFASCVDDGEFGITHILRGEDHVSNSAVQMQIFEALGYTPPKLGHMALLAMKDAKLSKREGSASIRELREQGILPIAVSSYLAKIGTSDAIELANNLNELTDNFSCSKFGRSTANFENEELCRLNAKLLHEADFVTVQEWLIANNIRITENFWEQIKSNIKQLSEVKDWWELIEQPVKPNIEDGDYCNLAAETFAATSDDISWADFTKLLAEKTGRKGKQLFMPLRLALTARTDGPELPVLFKLLGRDKIINRLRGIET
jgi:glutamyl-tRNA synthetase